MIEKLPFIYYCYYYLLFIIYFIILVKLLLLLFWHKKVLLDRMMDPKDVSTLISKTYEHVSLHSKGE